MSKELTSLEALEDLRKDAKNHLDEHTKYLNDRLDIIEKELILLNALRNKLNRKIETKEYKHEASNGYRIATLLTYELEEQWNDKELQALKQFLLNLSGISKELKALEIIKEKRVDVNDLLLFVDLKSYNEYVCACDDNDKRTLTKEEYDFLKEVLKND